MQPTITVCSDASYSLEHKLGTWACYIRTPDRVIQTGGVIKQPCTSSTHAERLGLANALWLLGQSIDLSSYRLIVYCDNVAALKRRALRKTPASRVYQEAAEYNAWFAEHIERWLFQAKEYECRHVKGHLKRSKWKVGSQRNYMNRWCDHYAKSLLRDYIRTQVAVDNEAQTEYSESTTI